MISSGVNTRELILEILLQIEEEGEHSHIAIRNALSKYQFLPKQERSFITRVCEGTLEYRIYIDYVIDSFSKVSVNKMKPQIREKSEAHFRFWADGMSRIADETAAVVKFSALITEADADWTVEDLKPYVDHVFSAFGAERVMWGSDWPVCRLRGEYADWRAAALELTSGLSEVDRALVFGGTAAGFYGL